MSDNMNIQTFTGEEQESPARFHSVMANLLRPCPSICLQTAIQKYNTSAPKLSAWLEDNLSEG